MPTSRKEPDQQEEPYSGDGWNLISFQRVSKLAAPAAAPLLVFGFLILAGLLTLGIYLIWRLIGLAWSGNADEAIRAASAALTAIAAIFGAVFLTWRTVVAHWQARASQQQAAVSRESHYTTLFTKAVEQLGATREIKESVEIKNSDGVASRETITRTEPNLEVRLGAIYAFARIVRDSERDHRPIIEVLAAYVSNPQNCGKPESQEEPRLDVQAALDIIGRYPLASSDQTLGVRALIFFDEANLKGAVFYRGDFSKTAFNETNLEDAVLIEANLQGCMFSGGKFKGAQLEGANLAGAFIFDADWSEVEGLTNEQLSSTIGDDTVKLPLSLARPSGWVKRILTTRAKLDLMVGDRAIRSDAPFLAVRP